MARAMACNKKVCHQLHLPVQSGSNQVLFRMNRNYSREDYLERIGWLKSFMPDISLSTDIIVGFPEKPMMISDKPWSSSKRFNTPISSPFAIHRGL